MRIEPSIQNILDEIYEFHRNDENFILRIIDYGSDSTYQEKIILKKLITRLKNLDDLTIEELTKYFEEADSD